MPRNRGKLADLDTASEHSSHEDLAAMRLEARRKAVVDCSREEDDDKVYSEKSAEEDDSEERDSEESVSGESESGEEVEERSKTDSRRNKKRNQPDSASYGVGKDAVNSAQSKQRAFIKQRLLRDLKEAKVFLTAVVDTNEPTSDISANEDEVEGFDKILVETSDKARKEMARMIVYKVLTQLGGLSSIKSSGMFFSNTKMWKIMYESETHMFMIATEIAILETFWDFTFEEAKAVAQTHFSVFMKRKKEEESETAGDRILCETLRLLYEVLWTYLMGSITCREAVATFICKERSAFIKKVSMLAPQLHSAFCKLESADLDLLRFAGVQEEFLPEGRAGWKPHENNKVVPVTTVQRGGHCVYSLTDAQKNCSTGLSSECVFDWTQSRNPTLNDETIELLMALAGYLFLPDHSPKTKEFFAEKHATCAQFFGTISKFQMAWLWTVLLRRGNGAIKGSNKHHAAAGHGNALFDRCNAWMRHWAKQLQEDQRFFSIPNGLELLCKNKVIATIARPATSGKKQKRRRIAATEDDDGDWNTSSQDPFGR